MANNHSISSRVAAWSKWWVRFGHEPEVRDRLLNFAIYFFSIVGILVLLLWRARLRKGLPPLEVFDTIPSVIMIQFYEIFPNYIAWISILLPTILVLYFILLLYALLAKDRVKLLFYSLFSLSLVAVYIMNSFAGRNIVNNFFSPKTLFYFPLMIVFSLYPVVVGWLIAYVYQSNILSFKNKVVKFFILFYTNEKIAYTLSFPPSSFPKLSPTNGREREPL